MRQLPSRTRLRYRGHDYRAPCSVHVTICIHHHQRLFGNVAADGIQLNGAGQFVETSLRALHSDANGLGIDTHMVMPDHLHAILVHAFKMRIMKSWPKGIRLKGWEPYDTHLWQRSYYDTLIRNDRHLETTRQYILGNPDRWVERMES